MQVKFVKIGLNKFMQFGILAFRALERMGHWPTVKKLCGTNLGDQHLTHKFT